MAEFALPAMAPGAFSGLAAGGLAAFAGQPPLWSVVTGLALGVPLALLGAGYAALMVTEKVPTGVFLVAAGYWLLGFPAAMMIYAIVTEWLVVGQPGLPEQPLGFLLYKALLSTGFAIGFLWVQEQLGRHWWPRIRDHNVYAERTVERYKEAAVALEQRKRATKRSGRQHRAGAAQSRRARPAAR